MKAKCRRYSSSSRISAASGNDRVRMRRRQTISEQLWPKDAAFDSIKAWPAEAGTQILRRVWLAYDDLRRDILPNGNWARAEDEVERSLTAYHSLKIQQRQTGDEPFILVPE